jgi:hypothetical protein
MLSPANATAGAVHVIGKPELTHVSANAEHFLHLRGTLAPSVQTSNGHLVLYGRRLGTSQRVLRLIAQRRLDKGATSFAQSFKLHPGSWRFKVTYTDPPAISAGSTPVRTVQVP